jgi:cyclohexanecarboxylate-CoA ligase
VATAGRDTGDVVVIAEHNDGWYDTGDLAVPDGRVRDSADGSRRRQDRWRFMIPV